MNKTTAIRDAQAFTLIELLVVIGIIAILMAMLAPSASGVLERSREASCQSNLRQLALACLSLAGDNNGTLPHNWEWVSTSYSWDLDGITNGTLYAYVRDPRPYRCPTFYRIISGAQPAARRASYSMNFRVAQKTGGSDPGPYNVDTIGGMARPAACVFLTEENPTIAPWYPTTVQGVQVGNAGLNDGRLCWGFGTEAWNSASVRDALATYHRDASCMAVAFDGHTSRVKMDTQFKWRYLMDPIVP